jgi:hypothetical protein
MPVLQERSAKLAGRFSFIPLVSSLFLQGPARQTNEPLAASENMLSEDSIHLE